MGCSVFEIVKNCWSDMHFASHLTALPLHLHTLHQFNILYPYRKRRYHEVLVIIHCITIKYSKKNVEIYIKN